MKNTLIIGLALVLLSGMGYYFFVSNKQNVKPVVVHLVPVQQGEFAASTTGQGKLIARKKEQLVSLIGGVVIDKNLSVGQFIPKGTVVAFMRLLEPELSKKKQDLEYALLDLNVLKEQLQQSEELLKLKAISGNELNELKLKKYKQERLVEELRKEVSDRPVTTSFSGLLVEKSYHDGDHVAAGAVLATIVDTSSFAVEIVVGQHQIPFIRLGQLVQYNSQIFMRENFGNVIETPKIAMSNQKDQQFTSGQTEPQFTVVANIKAALRNNILIGSQIESRFIIQEKQNTVFIPIEALLYRNDTSVVFVSTKGIARKRYVQTGLANDKFIEITSGITAKDTVVTIGNLDIEDGTIITGNSSELK